MASRFDFLKSIATFPGTLVTALQSFEHDVVSKLEGIGGVAQDIADIKTVIGDVKNDLDPSLSLSQRVANIEKTVADIQKTLSDVVGQLTAFAGGVSSGPSGSAPVPAPETTEQPAAAASAGETGQ